MKSFLFAILATLILQQEVHARGDLASPRRSTRRDTPAVRTSQVDSTAYNCALQNAKAYYAQNASKLKQSPRVIALVDLGAPANSARMSIVNLDTGEVKRHMVARGSGGINARSGSHGSLLGFMKVSEPYIGKHGSSARIDGLEARNSNARSRAIVIHGASYVTEGARAGRSWGCFAVDRRSTATVINKLKGGGLIYSYNGQQACSAGEKR